MNKVYWIVGCIWLVVSPVYAQMVLEPVDGVEQLEAEPGMQSAVGELSLEQKVSRLEHQIDYLSHVNVVNKMTRMQEEMARLQGMIESQNHQIEVLRRQERTVLQELAQWRHTHAVPGHTDTSDAASASHAEVKVNHMVTTGQPSVAGEQKLDAKSAYRDAFEALRNHQYEVAEPAFWRIVRQEPASPYVPNAYYWLGEIYLLHHQFEPARKAFLRVLGDYPTNGKVPDALLKLGVLELSVGNEGLAKTYFSRLQKEYPSATATHLAKVHMKRFSKLA